MRINLTKRFTMDSPLKISNTPVYQVDLGEGVLGKGNKNGTILVSDKITDPKERQSIIEHEAIHVDQVKRGDLDYDDENVYWKGKTYPRSKMNEGNPDLPWEKEAYSKTDPYEKY